MNDYPLIRRLARTQFAIFAGGLVVLATLNAVLYRAEAKAASDREMDAVRAAVAPEVEKLLAWQALGMREAVARETAAIKRRAPLESIEIVREADAAAADPGTLILPDPEQPSVLGYRLVARTPQAKPFLGSISPAVLTVVGVLSALFLGLVAYSQFLLRRYFSTILQFLEGSLRRLEEGRAPSLQAPEAEGEVRRIIEIVENLYRKARETERSAALGHIAKQVAHDIRSPLAALDAVMSDLGPLPEDKRSIVRNAVGRIRDIADDLLKKR